MTYPLLIPTLVPFLLGVLILIIKQKASRTLNICLTFIGIASSVTAIIIAVLSGVNYTSEYMHESLFYFGFDGLSGIFAVTTNVLWLIVAVYSIGYMKHEENEHIYLGCMLMTLGALNCLFCADNLFTLYFAFELATLTSMPLVLSSMTPESLTAAKKYLFYSIGGGFVALFGVIAVYADAGPGSFIAKSQLPEQSNVILVGIFCMIIGFGTKAGLYPMHGWLPAAHPVAPSPASALLSGLIAEAGIFAVIRVIKSSNLEKLIENTWVQYTWLSLSLITVLIGSAMAYKEKHIKKRLAYSTVSQLSYIMAGLAVLDSGDAYSGAVLHYVFHAIIKVALFLCAGSIITKTGKTDVDELEGVGKDMPVTLICYTAASLGLIGIPPFNGFFSKLFLCNGALESSLPLFWQYAIPVTLIVSALLTAGYLLPITVKGFFPKVGYVSEKKETKPVMYIPLIILAILVIATSFCSDIIINLS